jgi:hypothetical protein
MSCNFEHHLSHGSQSKKVKAVTSITVECHRLHSELDIGTIIWLEMPVRYSKRTFFLIGVSAVRGITDKHAGQRIGFDLPPH